MLWQNIMDGIGTWFFLRFLHFSQGAQALLNTLSRRTWKRVLACDSRALRQACIWNCYSLNSSMLYVQYPAFFVQDKSQTLALKCERYTLRSMEPSVIRLVQRSCSFHPLSLLLVLSIGSIRDCIRYR